MVRKRDGWIPIEEAFIGHCQRKSAGLSYSAGASGLGRPKLTPLGECSGAG